MLKLLGKILKTKSEKDIQRLSPIVVQINEEFARLSNLTADELRGETRQLQEQIREELKSVEEDIEQMEAKAKEIEDDFIAKGEVYEEIEKLKTQWNNTLEDVLKEILPTAFAIVKETAKRFSENESIEVQAGDFDRELSTKKDFVRIEGDKAIYSTTWNVGGHRIKWNMVHYDVQLIGGVVLHQGKIAEMATGEGKTLVSTLPAFLNALGGVGVHMVTVNDYLAKRDAEWMGPLFEFHGLKVACIDQTQPHSEERKAVYGYDIVYGTNNEFGFDYLRDNMSRTFDELVQRKLHFAVIDEVDSVLIDDARTPLIISGAVAVDDSHRYKELQPIIDKLVQSQRTLVNSFLNEAKKQIEDGQDSETTGGMTLLRAYRAFPKYKALIKYLNDPTIKKILTKTENFYMQEQNKNMHKVDAELYFVIEEKMRQINLTDKGLDLINSWVQEADFFVLPDLSIELDKIEKSDLTELEKIEKKDKVNSDFVTKSERIHTVQQLLKAYTLFEKDIDYVLEDNKVKIVDEQTGRIMDGRRYSDGLHQALEAKENVKVENATQTFATISLQNYFRMYHKLAGMTGTASTEAGEFWQIYKLDVVEIPTNVPIARNDYEDKVYRTVREKYNALVEEIVELVKQGRPALVGTASVENSEIVSRMLNMRKIKHQVLNAKLHGKEADIVAEAGKAGTVTIATNMAGRGTDIKLGEGVKEVGGLAIIGTEKHESRRIDRQLRGRAGRQGDPGSSQFFVSLDDQLMRLFGSGRISNIMQKMGYKEGEVIQHSLITRSIERAQRKVEENNFAIRKRLLEYDDVMNTQRETIYTKRRNSMHYDRLKIDLNNIFYDTVDIIVDEAYQSKDLTYLKEILALEFNLSVEYDEDVFSQKKQDELFDEVLREVLKSYRLKNEVLVEQLNLLIKNNFSDHVFTTERFYIPFTDGRKVLNVSANMKKLADTQGKEIINEFEKNVTLAIIDESWKEHLRQMDDLRQSVQNTVYEQKDPLLIYKLEAFELFKSFLAKMNRDIISFLMKGFVPVGEESGDKLREEQSRRTDFSKLKIVKNDFVQPSVSGRNSDEDNIQTSASEPRHVAPVVRDTPKIGRNDICPCGSGKKYKNCHGKNASVNL